MEGFREYLKNKGIGHDDRAVENAAGLQRYLQDRGVEIGNCSLEDLQAYLEHLIAEGRNAPETLLDLARFCAYSRRPQLYIHLAGILNSHDILPLMADRVGELVGQTSREAIFFGFENPPLGTDPVEIAPLTRRLIRRMEGELTPSQRRDVLIWNYHGIPKTAFQEKKKRFESASSIDEFLAGEHERLVQDLRECLRTGRVWYEQEVTSGFVEMVAADQRLQTGVREGNRIIVHKVPFDPRSYLEEESPVLRRYHYCHCPLARSAIRVGGPQVSSTLCLCSAGFTKLVWDTLFDADVEVEVLGTVLDGHERCAFAIRIPEEMMK